MRRRHLESVSAALYGRCFCIVRIQPQLSVRGGAWGTAPSAFWYGAPGGTQGPLGKGGAAERWRVVYPIGIATRYGAKPATTRAYKSRPPPGRRTGRHPAVTLPRRRRLQSCPKISFAYFSSQKSSPPPGWRAVYAFAKDPSPPPGAHKPTLNSHNKSQFLFPNKTHYLCNSRPIIPSSVNFPLNKVKY